MLGSLSIHTATRLYANNGWKLYSERLAKSSYVLMLKDGLTVEHASEKYLRRMII